MYIRRTQTRSTATGESYFTYRLVRSERRGAKVRAVTLLNLRWWLEQRSGLGELLEADFAAMGENALYRASDALMKHRQAIEDALFRRVSDLFGLEATVTLYDLTNTYFEGEATVNPKAKRGPSKEKRTDCPLVTLGLVLDGRAASCAVPSVSRATSARARPWLECCKVCRRPRAR